MAELLRPFYSDRYIRCPVFLVTEGVLVARALCERFPKVMPALVKRAKDNLQRVADAAAVALEERGRQGHLISAADSKTLDHDMPRSWTAILMRLDGLAMLPHDEYPRAARADVLITKLFYHQGPEFLRDTYAEQLVTMRQMLRCVEVEGLDPELDELCGPEFMAWFRKVLPRYQKIVTELLHRDGEPLVNLLAHRNALGRAAVTYATAICLTVNENDGDTVKQAFYALEPMDRTSTVSLVSRRPGRSSELTLTPSTEEVPLPA